MEDNVTIRTSLLARLARQELLGENSTRRAAMKASCAARRSCHFCHYVRRLILQTHMCRGCQSIYTSMRRFDGRSYTTYEAAMGCTAPFPRVGGEVEHAVVKHDGTLYQHRG